MNDSASARMPALSVRNLDVAFANKGVWRPAVRDLSFDLEQSKTLAIVGESGSGKSVTALAAMGLLPEGSARITGDVRIGGRQVLGMPEEAMRAIRGNEMAMIFQEPMTSLNPVLTVGFQIAEAIMEHHPVSRKEAESQALALLERVRVPAASKRMNNYPFEFSGGMRQRVMIAMALACRPRILIADEPTTALDVTIQAQILELIKTLQQEDDMSVLFITHDMGVVAEMADRVLVMWDGRKIEETDTDALLTGPREPYSRALLAAVPRLGSMKGQAQPLPFPTIDVRSGRIEPPARRVDTMSRDAAPLLSVSGLSTRFPVKKGFFGKALSEVRAVENVSFEVRPGETLAFVGESGCGKSTLGRSIIRLVEPCAGSVTFKGQDIVRFGRHELQKARERIQMVFQDPFASLNPRRKIGAVIAEPMIVHGLMKKEQARERVAELLERVGLRADSAHRYPHEFSGGQRQRLCFARALALQPEMIIADESVSALDVTVKSQIVNLMMELQEELGLAILFISHDMAVVERISHRIAVMYLGEIVEIGPRKSIIENPQHPYTRRLMEAIPLPEPGQRHIRRPMSNEEPPNPIHPVHYHPPRRTWRQIDPDHRVLEDAAA